MEQIVCFLLSESSTETAQVQTVTKRLIEQVYDQNYNEYVQDKDGVAVEFARELRDKKVHYDICKTSHNTQVLE